MRTYLYLLLLFTALVVGCSKWNLEPKTIKPVPTAAFAVLNDGCTATCSITFTNQSTNATSYQWDFGDKTNSTETNPVKQYAQGGSFTVTLTATGPFSSTTTQRTVTVKTALPTAAFVASSYTCTAPCSITYTNQSTNATSYQWDFGDNTTSTQTSPVKQYTVAGTFNTKLTAAGPGSSTTTQQTVTILYGGLTFTWQKLPDFPGTPRTNAGVFVIGNKAYVAGGYFGPESPTNELWEFDVTGTTPVWTQKANLSRKGAYATGFANAATATGYITGLYTDKLAVPGEVQVYNQAANSWTTRSVSLLNRTYCSACVVGDKAYIGIGQTHTGSASTNQSGLLLYNMTTGVATAIPPTGVGSQLDARLQPVMLPVNGKCLIGLGRISVGTTNADVSTFIEYDPVAATFTSRPDKPAAVTGIVTLKGRYFGLTADPTQVYEYKNDTWQLVPQAQINTPATVLSSGVGFVVGDAFYLGLGTNSAGVRINDMYKLTLN